MFGLDILDVAIGIIFIYLIVSVICSAVREGMETWFKTRAAYLEHGIRELLHDREASGLVTYLYNHPLVFCLFSGGYYPERPKWRFAARPPVFAKGHNLPSYIPAKNFALALMDIAARGPGTDLANDPDIPMLSPQVIRRNLPTLNDPVVERVVLTAIDTAGGDLNIVRKNIEDWYNSAMDRVSGWYRRSTHIIIFAIGLVIAALLNVNPITIADYLYRNSAARAALVAKAENASGDPDFLERSWIEVKQELDQMGLPIGWSAGWGAPRRGSEPGAYGYFNNLINPIVGWLLTALAATVGAPFWFDILNKVIVIRGTVKPHEKSPEEASEDRQLPSSAVAPLPAVAPPSVTREVHAPLSGARPRPIEDESTIDGCDVVVAEPTRDEDLPPSTGGVARHG